MTTNYDVIVDRDFMVSNYSDTGAAQWLADRGIALLRGRGRLAGTGVVEVDGMRQTAEHVAMSEVARTATYTHAYAESNGLLTLLSDGDALTGAYALGPEAGEWPQQATLAIRARVPNEALRETIQPFPSFSEIHAVALKALHVEINELETATH